MIRVIIGQHTIRLVLPLKDTEPWELIYFRLFKSQLPVVQRALEVAGMMLGTDKSRGYCLEMIGADFLAGADIPAGERENKRIQ